ncbi:2-nitropropane dioxygenase [Cristinia sonorae]|uniref:2-nitropropane dioxygenase n=1 Tax=Cristinia sonorae TaxID=1940300 RepID=A0A8K0XTT8_9AGAR|nr:2-nitropropane dioxygenase [Cristinia sonorae]
MQPITTRFTKLMNIKTPIVAAPMAFASTPELAAAVTAAGGLGLFGAGFDSSEKIRETFKVVREKLNIPKGKPVPFGVGVIGWILDMTEGSDDARIPTILEEMPEAIWFAFGDLGKYIKRVHEYDAKREHKTKIFAICNSAEDALRAVNEWKVDVVVAQGNEAGGHGGSISPPVLTVVQSIKAALGPNGPPVLAAGAVTTGAQVAALLTLGADGVVCGTRFLFTPECCYTDAMKEVLVDADLQATKRSLCFDDAGRTNGWPPLHDGRAIANKIWDDFSEGLSMEERHKRFDASAAKGEKDRLVIWAGVGAGLVKEIKPAAEVLRSLHDGALESLRAARQLTV